MIVIATILTVLSASEAHGACQNHAAGLPWIDQAIAAAACAALATIILAWRLA